MNQMIAGAVLALALTLTFGLAVNLVYTCVDNERSKKQKVNKTKSKKGKKS